MPQLGSFFACLLTCLKCWLTLRYLPRVVGTTGPTVRRVLDEFLLRLQLSNPFFLSNLDFELLPIEALDLAAAIEADRMRNAFIREEDRATEMTVVRNEFERGENDPVQALEKAIWATAFQAHP